MSFNHPVLATDAALNSYGAEADDSIYFVELVESVWSSFTPATLKTTWLSFWPRWEASQDPSGVANANFSDANANF